MAHHTAHRLACLLILVVTSSAERSSPRWSRQISSYTSDISDWVPLPGPLPEREPLPPSQIKRQSVAEPRILAEPFPGFTRPTGFSQDAYPSRTYLNTQANRQLYLQSVPSAPQNFLSDQGFGQSFRFGLAQPNFPLSQGFVAPPLGFENVPAFKPRPPVQSNPIKFEHFPKKQTLQSPPLSLQSPQLSLQSPPNPLSSQAKPFLGQAPKPKPESPKFVDGYRAVNDPTNFSYKKKPQSLQKLKFESFEKVQKPEVFQQTSKPKSEREEVQLLYVPVEALNRGQFEFQNTQTLLNSELHQNLPKHNYAQKPTFSNEPQRPVAKPTDNFNGGQDYFHNYNNRFNQLDQVPKFSTVSSPFPTSPPTTSRPKKLKPHQPPLAIFLTQDSKKSNQIKVGDVLSTLKNANSIAVLDSVGPSNAPTVFIGPSSLNAPANYVSFELPYLSNIENSDKKLKQLPFFVAPLSYNTPQGFAKIPFPSPHVGSVVINAAQIKDTSITTSTPKADVIPNAYSPTHREPKPVTQKPNFSYYSTAPPKTNTPNNYQSNYYSFEPQTVSTVKAQKKPEPSIITAPPKPGYFPGDLSSQYNPNDYVNFPVDSQYKTPEPVKNYDILKTEPTPARSTPSTTSKPSTYPSQLLETHNPYSINQAFHFSTPLDYQTYFDESYATQGTRAPPSSSQPAVSASNPTQKPEEIATEKQKLHQTSPSYLQNYSPEIHYESEIHNTRFPLYNQNEYTIKPEYTSVANTGNTNNYQQENFNTQGYTANTEIQTPISRENLENNKVTDADSVSTRSPYVYDQYKENYNSVEIKASTSTTSTTTTTSTRRTPLRSRGRPRYTTTPRTDSSESTSRTVVTRRPLRERKPSPTRPRYEPNRITSEKPGRKAADYGETTTKSTRGRVRGRVQYKPSENDDTYDKRNKGNSKEQDLAYQRDVLHQNYPVTIMERASTVDIEAITEPALRISSTRNLDATESYDTENAYTHEKASISQQHTNNESNEDIPTYSSRTETHTEAPYVPKLPSTKSEEYVYHSRSSSAPIDAISYDDISEKEDRYLKYTTPIQSNAKPEVSFATEPSYPDDTPNYSISSGESTTQKQDVSTQEIEITKLASHETSREIKEEEPVQTTPSYNRVRVRPGVVKQYHQASSTESSKIKTERKRPIQAITYRPAFERRRTTVRIDEIEADFKTKQVHARPEQEYRHPVYKPEPTTQQSATSSSQEITTKRNQFRRRRPSYTSTSTEATNTKKTTNEVKNRFRGRRPTTEKAIDKTEQQTEIPQTSTRSIPYSRYTRPRLSDRYNKKPEQDQNDDQDQNSSITIPRYVSPENEQWSPKISADTFKPYNPNEIIDDHKTTDIQSKDIYDQEIITARNEYDDILVPVTPATNTRDKKKIPDIPPTLEALVEQSKGNTESNDQMSTFETMLEEVMKSLEEQDENEYASNVMKHKGGEIGEIPPETIVSGNEVSQKPSTAIQEEPTTVQPLEDSISLRENDPQRKSHRRGVWKKVKVRPATTESIETAESQYYTNTVNRLGQAILPSKSLHGKGQDKPKITVTTYKPKFQFIQELFQNGDEAQAQEMLSSIDVPKISQSDNQEVKEDMKESSTEITNISPGDQDLGTGTPDPTVMDSMYYSTPTEATSSESMLAILDRNDGFSFMDYLFGTTADDKGNKTKTQVMKETFDIEMSTEVKSKASTTESTNYIPEEITADPTGEDDIATIVTGFEINKVIRDDVKDSNEESLIVDPIETSSVSSFMDPEKIVSTSMSTEVSHETEICFRGKCIKTSKDILL